MSHLINSAFFLFPHKLKKILSVEMAHRQMAVSEIDVAKIYQMHKLQKEHTHTQTLKSMT